MTLGPDPVQTGWSPLRVFCPTGIGRGRRHPGRTENPALAPEDRVWSYNWPATLTAEHPDSGPAPGPGPVSVSVLLLQAKVDGCEKCRSLFNKEGRVRAPATTAPADGAEEPDEEKEVLKNQLREMELELAQTKLQLVEAECKIQVRLDPCAQLPTSPCSNLRWRPSPCDGSPPPSRTWSTIWVWPSMRSRPPRRPGSTEP